MADFLSAPGLRLFAYLAAAAICVATGVIRSRRPSARVLVELSFWLGLCTLLVLLAVLKESGVQVVLGDEARGVAKSKGWYGERRIYQAAISGALMSATVFVLLFVLIFLGEMRRSFGLAILGAGALVCFVAIRALSLHQTDALLYRRSVQGLQINVWLELGLIAFVGFAAAVAILVREPRRRQ